MLDIGKMKALREEKGLTQEEAARRAGLTTRQQWNRIETGQSADVTMSTLDKIAKALGCKARDLVK